MSVQAIFVAIIILGAFVYAAVVFARKTRSFSKKSNCGADCGCESKTKS